MDAASDSSISSDALAAELSQCIGQLSRQKMRELQMALAGAEAAETQADHVPVQSLLDLLTVRAHGTAQHSAAQHRIEQNSFLARSGRAYVHFPRRRRT